MIDYYKELGVDRKATLEEIKSAYFTKLKKYHPDLYDGDASFAQDKTSLLNECYNTLKNEELRSEYDKQLFGDDENSEHTKYKDDIFKEFFKNLKINLKLRHKEPKEKTKTEKTKTNAIVKKEDETKTKEQLEKERLDKNKLTGLIIITVFVIIVIIALIFVL